WGDETDQPLHDLQWLHSGVLHTVHIRALPLRCLRRVEETRRATGVCVPARPVLRCHIPGEGLAGVTSGRGLLPRFCKRPQFIYRVAPVKPKNATTCATLGTFRHAEPALFVYPCGGVLVEQHVRRPTTRRGGTGGLGANRLGGTSERHGALAAVHSGLRPGLYRGHDPAPVNVDCPGPVREDVPSHSLLSEGLTGEHHWLVAWLQRCTPTIPLHGLRSRRGGDVHDLLPAVLAIRKLTRAARRLLSVTGNLAPD